MDHDLSRPWSDSIRLVALLGVVKRTRDQLIDDGEERTSPIGHDLPRPVKLCPQLMNATRDLIGEHLVSSIGRCGGGSVLGRGQEDDLGQHLGRQNSSLRKFIAYAGGRRPSARERCALRLSLAEREEISRGLAAGYSLRLIARGMSRSASTICREVNANGGRAKYRA